MKVISLGPSYGDESSFLFGTFNSFTSLKN